jgi:CheY-like chemotaxis protein/nitrogen-specific signal transduction histidine kinase
MNKIIKLLVIDDDEVDRLQLNRALKSSGLNYVLTECENPTASPEILNESFDGIFLDYLLPGISGLALLKQMRDNGIKTPVVVITSQGNESIAVELMKAGASDYIVKNEITGHLLGQVLRNMLRISEAERAREDAVKALQISESRLAEAQRIAKVGNWEYNSGNQSLHCSPEVYNIFHFDKKSSFSLAIFLQSVHPEDQELFMNRWKMALEGTAINFDFRILTVVGIKYVNSQGYVVKSNNGSVSTLIGTLQDVTDRKLAEQQVMKAQQQAENSMKVREIFLANMSHEIRTPMNAILGFTRLLFETNLSAEQKAFIDAIHFSGENLLVIINDVLDLSKIQSGKMNIEKCAFNIHDVINGVVSIMHPKIQEKGLAFSSNIDQEIPPRIKGDPVRLNQVLTNLITNAIKFTEKGSVTLDVNLVPNERQGLVIQFKVIDTGIGIPEDKQNLIFENFVQASTDTTRKFGGTGLGLAIVKNLIELQDGKVSVTSSAGNGSIFTVILPFDRAEHNVRHINPEVTTIPDSFGDLNNARLLVVEDNAVNQLLVKKVLQKAGCKIDIAVNGLEAIKYVQENKYDVVLMDIQMPEMDGYTATEFIRNKLPAPVCEIPIIAMTAHAFGEDVNRCLAAGMNDHISKPFNHEDLYRKILRCMGKSDQTKMIRSNGQMNPVRRLSTLT